ncbi:hypothetical protein V3481_014135 [Fusarium oxysporum f. sp. vasinfectum]
MSQYPTQKMEGQKSAKTSKSCIPCRDHKIRCDAPLRGLPCSNCVRKSWEDRCILPTRKRREMNTGQKNRTGVRPSPPSIQPTLPESDKGSTSHGAVPGDSSPESTTIAQPCPFTHNSDNCRDLTKYQTSLTYVNILEQADMNGTISRNQSNSLLQESPNPASSSTPLGYSTIISQQLDPIDRAFLAGKGVFDLPPQHCLEAILRAHFDFVDPFAPIMDRPSFIRSYKSGCYSLFLMHATLASGAMHVSSDIILECGFGSRLGAQISFSSKATLLYDFGCETDTLHLLQGCVLLGGVAIPSVVEKDCRYWLYNSIRLITRLDLQKELAGEKKDSNVPKLYRRMWWTLYCRDVHYTYIGAQRTGVVSQLRCNLSPLTPDDWSPEIITEDCASLLQPLKNQHISAFISYCQLAVTVNQCLTDHQDRSPESIIQPIEAWRVSVQENLQMNNQSQFDRMSSFLLASSYRFECILLRLFRPKWQSLDTERSEQARRQLRYAMFELDTIAGRMLTCNTLLEAPLAL